MRLPCAILFDLDNTLTGRVEPAAAEMTARLKSLLDKMPVGVISAASFPRIKEMLGDVLPAGANMHNLYFFPDMGGQGYIWQDDWKPLYENVLADSERAQIVVALTEGMEKTGIVKDAPQYGERIEVHEAQVIFTGLGLRAPTDEKTKWDPHQAKRKILKRFLEEKLPEFEIYIGGRTTIDIVKKSIDKAYGVRQFAKHLGVETREMLYIGDELSPGGNDAVVISTGIQTRSVSGPSETLKVIDELLSLSV